MRSTIATNVAILAMIVFLLLGLFVGYVITQSGNRVEVETETQTTSSVTTQTDIVPVTVTTTIQTSVSSASTTLGFQPNPTLIIGGSLSLYPVIEQGAAEFTSLSNESSQNITINVTQQGPGSGLVGVALGVLDIDDTTSFNAVASAVSEFPSVNFGINEIGGTGVLVISNGLVDGSGSQCGSVTLSALDVIFEVGSFYLCPFSCSVPGKLQNTLNGSEVFTKPAPDYSGPFTAVSRSDLPSGTEDSFCAYLNSGVSQPCASISNNVIKLPGLTESGNEAVLTKVQTTHGTVGFVDSGFADGMVANSSIATIFINQIYTQDSGLSSTPVTECTLPGATDCWAKVGDSTTKLQSFLELSLSDQRGVDNFLYPDIPFEDDRPGLTSTFWMVTNGVPDTPEQGFITFLQSVEISGLWHDAGFFAISDWQTVGLVEVE